MTAMSLNLIIRSSKTCGIMRTVHNITMSSSVILISSIFKEGLMIIMSSSLRITLSSVIIEIPIRISWRNSSSKVQIKLLGSSMGRIKMGLKVNSSMIRTSNNSKNRNRIDSNRMKINNSNMDSNVRN